MGCANANITVADGVNSLAIYECPLCGYEAVSANEYAWHCQGIGSVCRFRRIAQWVCENTPFC